MPESSSTGDTAMNKRDMVSILTGFGGGGLGDRVGAGSQKISEHMKEESFLDGGKF